jgi:hypothetical protein
MTPEELETDVPEPEELSAPRAEMLRELLPTIPEDRQREVFLEALSEHQNALMDREAWESRLAEWERQYFGELPEKNFPWAGAANFNVPLTMVGVETMKPRLAESILGEKDPILLRPTESADDDKRDRIELFLNWQLRAELQIEDQVWQSAHEFLQPGITIAKVYWRVEDRRTKSLRAYPLATGLDQVMADVLGTAQLTEPATRVGDGAWELRTKTAAGAERVTTIYTAIDGEELLVRVEKDERVYEGPSVDLIDAPDFIMPANAGPDIQRMPWIEHRMWLSPADLKARVADGQFGEAEVAELLRTGQTTDQSDVQDAEAYRQDKADREGVELDADTTPAQYEILARYQRMDLDDDGVEEEVIYWYCPDLPNKLLGWNYLDNVYAHGRRPFRIGRYFPLPGRTYGLSFAEIVADVQDEINTIHNQRVDYGTLQNIPFYFFRAGARHVGTMHLRPGIGIPVDSPQDVLFPRLPGTPAFGQNEEALLYQYFERLTGVSDLALGRQPNRVGATRTASGTSALLSEAGLRFRSAMRAFQRFWIGVFTDVLALNQQYLSGAKEFRVTGRWPPIIKIQDRSEIAGKYDLTLVATSETLHRQLMREDITAMMQGLLSNPLPMQLGLLGPRGIRILFRRFLTAYGETDPDRILEVIRQEPVRAPAEETAIFVNGGDVQPNPAEDLQAHIQEHQRILADPVARAVLGPEQVGKLERHVAQTIQLAQMQMVAQQMQQGRGQGPQPAVAGEQANNAAIGRQVGMGPGQPAGMGTANGIPQQ